MICIINLNHSCQPVVIDGWIIAIDLDDARRQAESINDYDLANYLYTLFEVKPGKYLIPNSKNKYLLVT